MRARDLGLGLLVGLGAGASVAGCKPVPPLATLHVVVEPQGDKDVLATVLDRRLAQLKSSGAVPFRGVSIKARPDGVGVDAVLDVAACDDAALQRWVQAVVETVGKKRELVVGPALVPSDAVKTEVASAVKPAKARSLIPEAVDVEDVAFESAVAALGKVKLPDDMAMGVERVVETSGVRVWFIPREAPLGGKYVAKARLDTTEANKPCVVFELDPAGTAILARLTTDARPILPFVLDGRVVSAPRIMAPITDGRARIELGTGTYEEQLHEARALVTAIDDGSFEAPLKVVARSSSCVPQ